MYLTPPCPSAATSNPAGAARWAAKFSTFTCKPKPSWPDYRSLPLQSITMNILHVLPWEFVRKAWPLAVFLTAAIVRADDTPARPSFDESADKALQAMKKRAEELGIKGVAVIAFSPGEKVESWPSKMLMVGEMTHEPNAQHKGDNLLAIAYATKPEKWR